MLDDLKHGAEDGISRRCRSTTRNAAPGMEDQQAPTPDDQTHGAEDVGSAGATLDEQKCYAEDGGQAPTLNDLKHGAEDGGPAGLNARRSEVRRRRWRTYADA